jgi:thiosulfate/3-mercaptopyruvate sulfurtransferase
MLVDTDWLTRHLDDPGVVVVDLRWREDGSGKRRFGAGHIPGAVHLDWALDIVDPDHRYAFMLAPPRLFASTMERVGIGDEATVVAYTDRLGSGPHRLWWASRVYGHDDVLILDGGFDKWLAEGRPLSRAPADPGDATWTPRRVDGTLIATLQDVVEAEGSTHTRVLDSRPPEQFRGEAVWFETGPVTAGRDGIARTPRGDLRAGRIPWAVNVPSVELYRGDLTMKPPGELREMFAGAGVTPSHRAITACGVGISAAALLFALNRAGVEDAALYDASWEEWGRDASRPVTRG